MRTCLDAVYMTIYLIMKDELGDVQDGPPNENDLNDACMMIQSMMNVVFNDSQCTDDGISTFK